MAHRPPAFPFFSYSPEADADRDQQQRRELSGDKLLFICFYLVPNIFSKNCEQRLPTLTKFSSNGPFQLTAAY
jgi:hypothetical protein